MIEPTQADIGRKVIYRDRSGTVVEEGVVTSFNEKYVFARYGSDTFSKAAYPRDLEWAFARALSDKDRP